MEIEDAGCLATTIPSPTRPGPIQGTAFSPHVAACPHLGTCRGSRGAPGGLIGAQRGCERVFPAAGNGFQGTVSMTAPAHPGGTLICCRWSSGVLPQPGAWRASGSRSQERERPHAGCPQSQLTPWDCRTGMGVWAAGSTASCGMSAAAPRRSLCRVTLLCLSLGPRSIAVSCAVECPAPYSVCRRAALCYGICAGSFV